MAERAEDAAGKCEGSRGWFMRLKQRRHFHGMRPMLMQAGAVTAELMSS